MNSISEAMEDPLVDEALGIIVGLTMNDDVAQGAAARLVVRMTAMAAQMKMKGKHYMEFENTKEKKSIKNIYFSLNEELHRLADALKYLAKS